MAVDARLVEELNATAPPANAIVGGAILSVSQADGLCIFEYSPTQDVVNAAGFIGAGYITQMLDQACAIAGIAKTGRVPTTLEIKTSCLKALRPATLRAEARVLRAGRSVAFIEATLRDNDGDLVATASMTANLVDMSKLREKSETS